EPRPIWNPPAAQRIAGGDRLIVVARRAGHRWLLEQAARPTTPPVEPGTGQPPVPPESASKP
ncbi:MAG TPA: hypothetical protein VFR67_06345, partial [Pilimelia sp.]|nr:hypothetical protein [Pilimelia sp.]